MAFSCQKLSQTWECTFKVRGSTHNDCNINVKVNHKILVVFYNLKNCVSHLIMQELGKFDLKIMSYQMD